MTVGDAPIQGCKLDELLHDRNWHELSEFYPQNGKMKVILEDWRLEVYHGRTHLTFQKEIRNTDEAFSIVDLGESSMLEPVSHDHENFRVTYYDPAALKFHHSPGSTNIVFQNVFFMQMLCSTLQN